MIMKIAKNFFQTYPKLDSLSVDYLENFKKIQVENPEWDCRIYDDAAVDALFSDFFSPDQCKLINKINPKYGVVKADLFRYVAIFKYGGVYLDIKSTLNRPLDQIIKPEHTLLLSQWRNRLGEEFSGVGLHPELLRVPGGEIQQWHVVAQAKHPLLKLVIDRVLFNLATYDPYTIGVGQMGVLRLSGPICYTNVIYPLFRKFPCQIVDAQSMGFQYSIYRKNLDRSRHARADGHYSKLNESIVL